MQQIEDVRRGVSTVGPPRPFRVPEKHHGVRWRATVFGGGTADSRLPNRPLEQLDDDALRVYGVRLALWWQ